MLTSDPGTRALSKAMMLEAKAIGDRIGVNFRVDVEWRINDAGAVGAHKTSMLMDCEAGRPMEIDPLMTILQEIGRLVHVETPMLDAVLALIKLREDVNQGTAQGVAAPAIAESGLNCRERSQHCLRYTRFSIWCVIATQHILNALDDFTEASNEHRLVDRYRIRAGCRGCGASRL